MQEACGIKAADDIEGVLTPFNNSFFIGHEKEQDLLCALVNNNQLHHAIIFAGEKGLGKASLALQFAHNLLNYNSNGPAFIIKAPCAESAIWRQMGQNIYPGFLYIAPAYDISLKRFKTSIGVEDIKLVGRLLQHSVGDSGRRIVIIDNIGDLNQYSANALLKMLEEPPANTLFILVSHAHKPILATIKSRCLTMRFKNLTNEQVKLALEHCLMPPTKISEYVIEQAFGNVRKAALLYLSDATKIYQKLDNLFAAEKLDIITMQKIAEEVTNKDSQLQYQQSIEKLLQLIARKATEKAKATALQRANELCLLWRKLYAEFNATNLYNLNKKQLLCDAIMRSFNVVHNK